MEPIEGSETSAFRTQTPVNYPEENTLHKEHGESLKSRSDRILIGFAHFGWQSQCVCVSAETAARHGTARHGTCAARRTPAAVPCNLLWCKNEHLTFAPHISTCFANLAGDKHNKLTPPPPDPRSWAAVSIGAPFRETWGNASFVGPSREVWAFSLLTFWRWNYFFLILAHPVNKIWIIQEPNKLELWNKLHFEEKKTECIYNVQNIQYLYLLNNFNFSTFCI